MTIGESLYLITQLAYEHWFLTLMFLLAMCPWNCIKIGGK